jgi:hypothetical protein
MLVVCKGYEGSVCVSQRMCLDCANNLGQALEFQCRAKLPYFVILSRTLGWSACQVSFCAWMRAVAGKQQHHRLELPQTQVGTLADFKA